MDGKYMPTHASKRKNATDKADNTIAGDDTKDPKADGIVAAVAAPIERVANKSIPTVNFSP